MRASAPPGTVRATLADRDRIDADDHVQIFLGTFADGRQAFVFGVNPFGVQADGALVEGGAPAAAASAASSLGREDADLSPDFVFQSQRPPGHRGGFEVEIRIPFKSLRYQSGAEQSGGCTSPASVQGSGDEDSWAPARRAGRVVPAQAGTLDGLHDLRRGLVLDLNPVGDRAGRRREERRRRALGLRRFAARLRRQRALGRDPDPDAERHGQPRLLAGGVRRRAVPVRSAPGAVLPREAAVLPRGHRAVRDAQQPDLHAPHRRAARRGQADRARWPRHERRLPVGGRRPVDVVPPASDHPVFNILRAAARPRRGSRRSAFVYTDRIDGDRSNRVAGVDTRLVLEGDLQPAAAGRGQPHRHRPRQRSGAALAGDRFTAPAAASACEPWPRASIRTSSPQRASSAGPASPRLALTNQLDTSSRPGALDRALQQRRRPRRDVAVRRVRRRRARRRTASCTSTRTWRCAAGGGSAASVLVESFGYDESLYQDYAVAHRDPSADGGLRFVPYTGARAPQPRLRGLVHHADAQGPHRRRADPVGQGRELLRVGVGRYRLRQRRRRLAADRASCASRAAISCSRSSAAPTAATSASAASRG